MSNIIGEIKDGRGSALLVSGVQATILGPYDLLRYPSKAFTIYNASTVTLSGAVIQINPDQQGYEANVALSNPGSIGAAPNAGLWETYDNTSFQSLTSGGVKTIFVNGNVARWWRIVGINHQPPDVLTSGWVYANAT